MRKMWVLLVMLSIAGALAACNSSSDNTKCTVSSDCTAGNVCQSLKCGQRPCNGTADCNGTDICVDGATLKMDASKRFCTALQCGTAELSCTTGFDCVGGLCIKGVTTDDVIGDTPVVGDTVRDGTVVDNATDGTTPLDTATDPGTGGVLNCTSCTADGDCGTNSKCLPVGATKHCLSGCTTDGDCPRSFICYASSTASKSCLPVSYNCVTCAVDTPCDTGKTCDFTSGLCKDPKGLCDYCTYDFDCDVNLRCYKKTGSATGACVPECSGTTPCSDTTNFTCGTTEKGVQLCQPVGDTCGGCAAATPFPSPDGKSCYACLNNSHCTVQGETCDITVDHKCKKITGKCGSLKECTDGTCQNCCVDADCAGLSGATGTCTNHTCDGVQDACNGQCSGTSFPVCVTVSNVPTCVQCGTTSDCLALDSSGSCTCTGDPTYACIDSTGNVCGGNTQCASPCSTDADCPPNSSGTSLVCSGSVGGFCYDASGACDGTTSCCAAGQTCYDVLSSLFGSLGGMGGAIPSTGGYCTCDDSHACLGGKPCTSTDGLCSIPILSDMLCPGGVKPSTMPDKVCVDVTQLLTSLLGGI